MSTLQERLDQIRVDFLKMVPAEAKAIMARATNELRASGITVQAHVARSMHTAWGGCVRRRCSSGTGGRLVPRRLGKAKRKRAATGGP